jgi:hypothetical protein
LVFEVEDEQGNSSLLLRALNIPDEKEIDVKVFTEKLLDNLEVVAKRRGIAQILVPGVSGAISNYQMTINHILESYVKGRKPVKLKDKFAFNNYDLTNNCYLARKVED